MTRDHWAVLGLAPGASPTEVHAARRRLAKRAHPDAGGSAAGMQALNAAAEAALAEVARTRHVAPAPQRATWAPPSGPPAGDSPRRRRPASGYTGTRVDHPSFVVEALPVEAFEWLLVAASELGDIIDDDPPYRLEVALRDELRGWCELTLVPDAGSSTVSLAVAGEPGAPPPDVERVRDAWVAALNGL